MALPRARRVFLGIASEGDSRDWRDGSVLKHLISIHMHEDLSSKPPDPCKIGHSHVPLYSDSLDSVMGDGDRKILGSS